MNIITDMIERHGAILCTVIALFAIFIFWGMFKRTIKVGLILGAVLAAYVGYLYFTGKPIPTAKELATKGQSAAREADEIMGKPIRRLEREGERLLVDNGDTVLDQVRTHQKQRLAGQRKDR